MSVLNKLINYRMNIIKNNLNLPLNSSVLDIGCGTGEISRELSKQVTGVDIDNYLKVNIKFVKIDKKGLLPFKDESFDYITFIDSLHHMTKEEQNILLNEAKRVSKKEIILFEAKPTLRVYLSDWILNRLRYGFKIPIPLNFKKDYEWGG